MSLYTIISKTPDTSTQRLTVVPNSDNYEVVNSPQGFSIRGFEAYKVACMRQLHPLHLVREGENNSDSAQQRLLFQTLDIIIDILYTDEKTRKSANDLLLASRFEPDGLLTRRFMNNIQGSLRTKRVNGLDIILGNISKTTATAHSFLNQ